jgi:hypothetical protein
MTTDEARISRWVAQHLDARIVHHVCLPFPERVGELS